MARPGKQAFIVVVVAVAIVIAAVCRTFVVETFKAAPLQMENSILQGDRLVVDKWSYGFRMPQSVLSVPWMDTIPGTSVPSYYPAAPLPYHRFLLKQARRNDIVVYNYPDTAAIPIARCPALIARCIGIPGDTVCAVGGKILINGQAIAQSPVLTEAYQVPDSLFLQVEKAMQQAFGKPLDNVAVGNLRLFGIDRYDYDKLRKFLQDTTLLHPVSLPQDNYCIDLPPYGKDAIVNRGNASFYADIINRYEAQKVELRGDRLYRGGREIKRYRFSQPYYWVLCDNRISTTDSRTFGVLPHSHLAGRCRLILFSIDPQQPGLSAWRTDRFFQQIVP